jgi:hypothetical protein
MHFLTWLTAGLKFLKRSLIMLLSVFYAARERAGTAVGGKMAARRRLTFGFNPNFVV